MFDWRRSGTAEIVAIEAQVVADREPFTVFCFGQAWLFVHWSRRPSRGYGSKEEAIADTRLERETLGLSEWPITLELS